MARFSFLRRKDPALPGVEARTADLSGFIAPQYASFAESWGGNSSTPEQALNSVISVYACVSLLADIVGSLPLHLYRKTETGRERIDTDYRDRSYRGIGYPGSLARLIGETPNDEMTAQELWTTAVGHCALWGNAYIEVTRDPNSGRPIELWPLRPDRMEVKRDGDSDLIYVYQLNRGKVVIPDIMHLRLFGTDGVIGLSPIEVARRTLGAEVGAQKFAENWYSRGATPSAIVTVPKGPQEKFKDRIKNYRQALENLYGGSSNAGRIAVLEEGIDWKPLSMSMTDMQFVETRKWTVSQIASLYRVPPHLIQDVERDSSWGAGIENQNLSFLAYTLRPILARIEGAICRDLGLVPGYKTLNDEGLYPEFVTADLLRADIKTRNEAYGIGVQWGYLTRADVREWENLSPIPGLEAPLTPTNMVAGDPPTVDNMKPPAPAPAPEPEDSTDDLMMQQNAALIAALTARALEPQQLQLPEITTPVNVYNKDVAGEMREALGSIPTPVVNVPAADMKPLAKMLGEIEAHRILDAEAAEERAAQRHRELLETLTPKPTRREVVRDKDSNIISIIDRPIEEAV